jgi:predicted alpha/beta-fold hydrolase
LIPFVPLFRNPHLATLAGHYWPGGLDRRRFPVEARLYPTEPGVSVLVETQRPLGPARGEIVLVHGLEGSSHSGYMLRTAAAALEAGFIAHRFNLRSCGGSEAHSSTSYHAGLTSDLRAFLEMLAAESRRPVVAAGFSLGGNIVLKLAVELGEQARGLLAGVCATSTPIDLEASVLRLEQPRNQAYERRFVRGLKRRIRHFPKAGLPMDRLASVRRLREFDELFTAPAFGFRDAAEYYQTQSARRFLGGIRIPFLMIQAKDDPVVPFETFAGVPNLVAVDHGGHLGFLARRGPRFWVAAAILEWVASLTAGTGCSSSPGPSTAPESAIQGCTPR